MHCLTLREREKGFFYIIPPFFFLPLVGRSVGALVGVLVGGGWVGTEDGFLEGVEVGIFVVGAWDGASEGLEDGAAVGGEEGEVDGAQLT
jgi:hypothetical protein